MRQFPHILIYSCFDKQPDANIVKLPNISASIPQLQECIKELRDKGYDVPLYPEEPKNDEEKEIQDKYHAVTGSAVNPVLREGNSDRRVAGPVKTYAQSNPHKMGFWSKASRSHVAHMTKGDFYSSEQSTTLMSASEVAIELVSPEGEVTVLKESTELQAGEVIDAATMSIDELTKFYENEIDDAKASDLLFSLVRIYVMHNKNFLFNTKSLQFLFKYFLQHLKATMMKVSDPILFGHCVKAFFKPAFEKNAETLAEIGANPNLGLGSVYKTIENKLPAEKAKEVINDFEACYEDRPWLAMVNSDKGITNLVRILEIQ